MLPSEDFRLEDASKFHVDASFEGSYGKLHVFHQGLTKLIGPPRLLQGPDGVPSIRFKMAKEHKEHPDSKLEFQAPNMKEEEVTRSEVEWEFVVDPNLKNLQDYAWVREADRGGPVTRRMRRNPWSQELLKSKMEEQNALLLAGNHDLLVLDEAIAARLYTGPSAHALRISASTHPARSAHFIPASQS